MHSFDIPHNKFEVIEGSGLRDDIGTQPMTASMTRRRRNYSVGIYITWTGETQPSVKLHSVLV